ncbi:MAG: hypothetical protein KC646_02215 [Candidatus Cloacimonetes bacterium]|nr:hypothetical protein [Candidatus Cloacimonadota bacterium]
MSKITLTLKKNTTNGKQELLIDYESDGDALPFEHEEDHKELVNKILESNGLNLSDIDGIQLNRQPVQIQSDDVKVEEAQAERKTIIQR